MKPQARTVLILQMRQFAVRMEHGDIVTFPLKNQPGQMVFGIVEGDYEFLKLDGQGRHTRRVKWLDLQIPRKDFGAATFHVLVPKMTVSPIRRDDVVGAIRAAVKNGTVPQPASPQIDEDPTQGSDSISVLESARDQIIDHIHQRFADHKLEHLVAAILRAQGFVVNETGPGPDLGVDVLAGHGPLGFDHPRICVQVKHTSAPVSQPEIQQLSGAMSQFGAEQGLFVSWSDYTSAAKNMARQNFFTMRLWNANDLLEAVFRHYEDFPDDVRAEIPLRRIWTLVPEEVEE